jgi:hypothetical protein
MNDPIADMLTRIRNSQLRGKSTVITPASKLRERVLEVMAVPMATPPSRSASSITKASPSFVNSSGSPSPVAASTWAHRTFPSSVRASACRLSPPPRV